MDYSKIRYVIIYEIKKCPLGMFCYKFNFVLFPDVFDNFFTKVSNVHRHHKRSQCNFLVRASRTIYVEKSVKYRGMLLWNQLRDNVKNLLISIYSKSNRSLFYVVHECQFYAVIVYICTPECIYVYFYQVFRKLTIFSFYSSSNHLCCVSIEQLDWNGDI